MKQCWLWFHVILLWVLLPYSLEAHGGGQIRVSAVASGPFLLSVWTNPPQAVAGRPLHITVGVSDYVTQGPVLDAQVEVHVVERETGTTIVTSFATTDQSTNKLFYETDIVVREPALYQIIVITTRETSVAGVSFELSVNPASQNSWLRYTPIGIGLSLGLILFRWWQKQQKVIMTPVRERQRP